MRPPSIWGSMGLATPLALLCPPNHFFSYRPASYFACTCAKKKKTQPNATQKNACACFQTCNAFFVCACMATLPLIKILHACLLGSGTASHFPLADRLDFSVMARRWNMDVARGPRCTTVPRAERMTSLSLAPIELLSAISRAMESLACARN